MKIRTIIAVVILATMTVSCDKTGAKPEIDFHELGFENSKTAEAGDELHMDAEVVAENKIDRIEVTLHPEGEHKKSTALNLYGSFDAKRPKSQPPRKRNRCFGVILKK